MSDIQVTITNAGPCRKLLAIEVPASEVDSQRRKLLELYARGARIPGFRPGKAPPALVERHYAKELREELKEHLLAHGYHGAVRQEKLTPVAAVDVTDESPILAGSPFSFKVTLDVPPVFTMPEYKGIPLEGQTVAVTDAQVEEAIGQFRERLARFNEIKDRPAKAGDIVKVDFAGLCDGKPVAEIAASCADVGKGQDFWLRLEEASDATFLPGVAAAVAGMENGATREIPVAFPADYHVKELANKSAVYTVTVKEIREKTLPELDGEFFQLAGVKDLEELRTRIRENLTRSAERNEEARRQDAAARYLLEHVAIDGLPETQVHSETQQIVMNIVRENTMRGISSDQIKDQRENILTAATRSSRERVKLSYILDRVAEAETIEVPEDAVAAQVARLAARNRETPEKLRAELEKDGRLDELRRELRNEQALAFIVKNAAVTVAKTEGAPQ